MAKKTAKVLKGLKKDVAKLQERYDKLAGTLEKTRENQASAHRELRDLLEERLAARDADAAEQQAGSRNDEGLEVTEAAQRRSGELGVALSSVKGTGSGGRVLVKDVEAAANEHR
jgi:pyruvate/2-oxoglutarate dehydrogenase complex dihydrolipoamide acyltransferase (E2) component